MCDLNVTPTATPVNAATTAARRLQTAQPSLPAHGDDGDLRTEWMRRRDADPQLRVYGEALAAVPASYLSWDEMVVIGAKLSHMAAADADKWLPAAAPRLAYESVFVVSMWDQQLMAPAVQRELLQALLDTCVSSWAGREAVVAHVAPIIDRRGEFRGQASRYKFAASVRSSMAPAELASVLNGRVALDAHGAWHVAHEHAGALRGALRGFADALGVGARHERTLGLPSVPLVFEVARDQTPLVCAPARGVTGA